MTTTDPVQSSTGPRRSLRMMSAVAVALVVLLAAVVTAVLVARGDEPATAAPLTQVQASCGDWMDSASADEPDPQWCSDMFAWMEDQSGGSMMGGMGSMMWQGSEPMGRACRQWIADERGQSGAAGPRRCDAMLTWMDRHMSSEDGRWMMHRR